MGEGESTSKKQLGMIVGIPFEKAPGWQTSRVVSPEWALTLAHLVYPTGLNHTVMAVAGKRIDDARNEIIEKALELDCPVVFFLDDDVYVPLNTILHLYPVLMSDPKVIAAGGIYSIKREPTEPMAYRKHSKGPAYDMKFGEVFDVEAIATGCLMVKTELFRQIEKPWFKTINESGQDKGRIFHVSMTDDMYFCRKATDAGFTIKADAAILCGHIDAENHKIYSLNQYLPKRTSPADPQPE